MAYKAYDLEVTGADDAFSKIQSAIVNMGWVLHDTVDATHKVYKSNGKEGDKSYGYIQVYNQDNYIYFEAYLYWDAETNTGTCKAYILETPNNKIGPFSSGDRLWIGGDKDIVFTRKIGSGRFMIVGHIPTFFNTVHTTLTGDATSGDSAILTVASTTGFATGMNCQIVGISEGRDKLLVESVTNATTLVITNLPRNYGNGAHLGFPAQCFGGTTATIGGPNQCLFYCVAMPDDVGVVEPISSKYFTSPVSTFITPAEKQAVCTILLVISWSTI